MACKTRSLFLDRSCRSVLLSGSSSPADHQTIRCWNRRATRVISLESGSNPGPSIKTASELRCAHRSSDAVLILGPGLEPDSKEITLVARRFQHRIVWWSAGDELPESNTERHERSRKRDRVLHAIKDPGLHELLGLCSESGRAVQLVSLAASVKAIRCNTPFVPSRFTEREEAYVRRIFSYYD